MLVGFKPINVWFVDDDNKCYLEINYTFDIPKYDVSISTACAGLDYIVVETTSVAQRCVELLWRENLGVATFMILDSLELLD
ncbi:structural maintenance of chromosomes protein 4-like [Corylus avellana]|uniref:structural maintenance of chromosomes protein 4-like n=1 Tax=Corylus avellana TaxID=13451 RepID=UPI00286A7BDC|nr:structural maintenance of chromosomes protein 4-like [Corylus avellana]